MDRIDIEIQRQEECLRFSEIDSVMIRRICDRIASAASASSQAVCILARVNKLVLYALTLPGASANNSAWAIRKANFCERYSVSSLHAMRNMLKSGKTFDECGMDSSKYGFSGGSFPLLLTGGLCIGSITVSGLSGEEDHQLVADAIASELGKQIGSVLS